VADIGALKRAFVSPPGGASRARPWIVVVLGVGLEAALTVPGDWHADYPGVTVGAGILVAALAGVAGGIVPGIAVGAAGWALYFFFVADESLQALYGLPAWILVGGAAGWLALSRRRTARGRQLAEDELTSIRESAAEGIVGVDLEGTIVSWSAGAEAIYGYPADEALGQPVSLLGGDEQALADALDAVEHGERLEKPSAVHRQKDGTDLSIGLTVAPIRDGTGEPAGAVLVATDVGERQRFEERLRETDAKYRALTEQLPAITYVHPVGERGAPIYVSPQVASVLGYSAQEWVAQPELFYRLLHPEDRERVRAEIAAAAEGTRALRCEYRMLSRDGRTVWVHDEAVTVRDDDGRPFYTQGYLLDVSERRDAAEERERLLAAERAASAEAVDRQRKLDFLARSGEILGSSRDYQATLRRVADLAVRDLADWCLVDLVDEEGAATRIAAGQAGPGKPGPEPSPLPEADVLDVIRRGRPELSESRMCVPLRARGRALGALTLLTQAPGRSYGADDLAAAQELAGMAALAVDNAHLTREVEEAADAARVLTYVADGVTLVDRTGTIRLWNPAAEAITGLPSDAVLGHTAAEAIAGWKTLAQRIPVAPPPSP
jgi:PAS domain S-box-containing protein